MAIFDAVSAVSRVSASGAPSPYLRLGRKRAVCGCDAAATRRWRAFCHIIVVFDAMYKSWHRYAVAEKTWLSFWLHYFVTPFSL